MYISTRLRCIAMRGWSVDVNRRWHAGVRSDNFMYEQCAMSYTRVDSLSVCLYVCHLDDSYVTAFAYYGIDSVHCHIPKQYLYPSVCLSLYVLPCWRPIVTAFTYCVWCAMSHTRAVLHMSVRMSVCHYMFAMLTTAMWQRSPTMTEIVWKCHIPDRFLYPFVCLSVCLSVTITLYVWRAGSQCQRQRTISQLTMPTETVLRSPTSQTDG